MTITVCISTKDRPLQLKGCVLSILKNSVLPDKIIIVNEGHILDNNLIPRSSTSKIELINHPMSNLSKGRNLAIKNAISDIVSFTDDDCIVDSLWIQKCLAAFKKNKSSIGVFGAIKPYQPDRHLGHVCPCTLEVNKQMTITKPCYHAANIGFGNNMAFRKTIFNKIGGFKNWLGAGSITKSAEDAEFALRMLVKGHNILYCPSMVVYHNKWLTPKEMRRQELSYACGEMACYGYFHFQKYQFASPVVYNKIQDSYYNIKNILKLMLFFQWNRQLPRDMYDAIKKMCYQGRGLLTGFIYSLLNPI